METIKQMCERLGITIPIYYKIAHKLKRRPTEEDVKEHKANRKYGRPRKENF